MAFQQPSAIRHATQSAQPASPTPIPQTPQLNESQEWILFAPSQAESSYQTETTRTAGLSRISDLGSFNTGLRSGQPGSSVLEDDATEDAELDSLDEGLHAFREPALYHTSTHQTSGPVLPAHDGLGSFLPSSAPVLEQLWQHEQFNPKRKHEGHHRRPSSIQRRLDTVDELEAQANEEKRLRIEKWRLEQSQALMEEVERETRRRLERGTTRRTSTVAAVRDVLGTTPKQSDYLPTVEPETDENEPFWRRITRKFIRDVIGIDEPLLSVILGETLPGELTPRPGSPVQELVSEKKEEQEDSTWRDTVLQRIAKELGVLVHQLTPHPGAFTTYSSLSADYAGMPVTKKPDSPKTRPIYASDLTSNFPPTVRDDAHAESWGFEEEPASGLSNSASLRKEREYWERELDVKMVFRYLRDRVATNQQDEYNPIRKDESAKRAAIIRQHHPLVARAHRAPAKVRRESRASNRRAASSCASESVKGSRKASALRSGSSRNYWDLGDSNSAIASGNMMGTWGEA